MTGIPILIKRRGEELPPLEPGSLRYVVAENGNFLERSTPMYRTSCRVERCAAGLERHDESCQLLCPPLPPRLSQQMLEFFRWTFSYHGGEGVLLLLHDPESGQYRWHCPPQRVDLWQSWTGNWYAGGDIHYTDPLELPEGCVIIGDAHSHADMPAYASATDKNDEKHKDGLHIVLGYMQRKQIDAHVDFVMDGERFRVEPEQMLPRLGTLPAPDGDEPLFPPLWREQVEVSRQPYRGGAWGWSGDVYDQRGGGQQ